MASRFFVFLGFFATKVMAEREGREKVRLGNKNVLEVQSDDRPVNWKAGVVCAQGGDGGPTSSQGVPT